MAKKVLKVAGIVAGVALIATGIGAALGGTMVLSAFGTTIAASTIATVAGAVGAAASLLVKPPGVPSSQVERLNASIDPRTFRKTVLGSTAMPVDIRYQEWFGTDQERCGWIVALASHRIDGVDEIWLNDELAWSATGGVTVKYNGYFWVRAIRTEGRADNTVSFGSGSWNGNHRLTGCAYAWLEFKVTGNSKKAESPFSGGVPSRVTIIGRGAPLYDPRRDSTVPGGSGAMRANDQATWRYTADDGAVLGENLALQILRVLIGGRIGGKLATGCGVPLARLNLASFQVAANLCDELVNRSAGGTEPRFRGAGVLSEGDDPSGLLDALCAACAGRLTDTGGKLGLEISHNDLAEAAADDGLNEDDVIGPFQWNPDPSLETTPTVVRGRYTDPRPQSLYQLLPYPDVTLPGGPEGPAGEVVMPLDLGFVESPSQAQRIARQALQRKQYDRTFTAAFDIRAWAWRSGQVVPLTFAPLGFERRLFRVVDQERGKIGECVMTLREENAAIYAWDASDKAPVQLAEPIVYDIRNSPLILGIGQAAETALWTAVEDNDPVNHPRPEDGATNGAPAGSPFGDDWEAQQAVDALEAAGETLIEQILRVDAQGALIDLRTFVEGQPLGAWVLDQRQVRETAEGLINSKINLLGTTTPDGTGFILNASALQSSAGKFLVAQIAQVEAALADQSASVTQLSEVVLTPSGSEAKAVLRLTANNHIIGFTATNDGFEGECIFVVDRFKIVDPNGGQPFTVFETDNGIVKMRNVEVDTIKAGSVTIDGIAPGLSSIEPFTGPDVQINGGEVQVLETDTFMLGDEKYGSGLATISFTLDSTTVVDGAGRVRLYADTGFGYGIVRNFVQGARTSSGNTYHSSAPSFPLLLEATAPVRLRLTVESVTLGGGDNHPGFWIRSPRIDVLKLGR